MAKVVMFARVLPFQLKHVTLCFFSSWKMINEHHREHIVARRFITAQCWLHQNKKNLFCWNWGNSKRKLAHNSRARGIQIMLQFSCHPTSFVLQFRGTRSWCDVFVSAIGVNWVLNKFRINNFLYCWESPGGGWLCQTRGRKVSAEAKNYQHAIHLKFHS